MSQGLGAWSQCRRTTTGGSIRILGFQGGCQCSANTATNRFAQDTALHCAAFCGHVELVRYLVETLGANVEATNARGNTTLHCACDPPMCVAWHDWTCQRCSHQIARWRTICNALNTFTPHRPSATASTSLSLDSQENNVVE
jgi:Ankyrin repeats (many copies)